MPLTTFCGFLSEDMPQKPALLLMMMMKMFRVVEYDVIIIISLLSYVLENDVLLK